MPNNFSPLTSRSNWGITIQESSSRHALGEREGLRRVGANFAEVYDNLERKTQEEFMLLPQGWVLLVFHSPPVLVLKVFTLLHCDYLFTWLTLFLKYNGFLNTDYILLFSVC